MTAQWMAVSVDGANAYVADLLSRLPAAASEALASQRKEKGWGMIVAEDDHVPEGWKAVPVMVLAADGLKGVSAAIAHIADGLADGFRIVLPAGSDFRSASALSRTTASASSRRATARRRWSPTARSRCSSAARRTGRIATLGGG